MTNIKQKLICIACSREEPDHAKKLCIKCSGHLFTLQEILIKVMDKNSYTDETDIVKNILHSVNFKDYTGHTILFLNDKTKVVHLKNTYCPPIINDLPPESFTKLLPKSKPSIVVSPLYGILS